MIKITKYIEKDSELIRIEEEEFFKAVEKNDIDKIERILDSKRMNINVNAQDRDGSTALIKSVNNEDINTNIVKMLLDNNADPNIQDKEGNTVLMKYSDADQDYITVNGISMKTDINIIISKMLLDNNADPNIQNKEGNTALINLVGRGSDNQIKFLLDNNADPNINISELWCQAFYFNSNTDTIKMLLENGVDYEFDEDDFGEQTNDLKEWCRKYTVLL